MEVYLNKKLPVFDHVWPGEGIGRRDSGTKFSIVGDMFCKEISWDIDHRWLDEYKKIREYEPRLVEVYGYEERKVYMQYIDGETLRRNLVLDAYMEA